MNERRCRYGRHTSGGSLRILLVACAASLVGLRVVRPRGSPWSVESVRILGP